VNRTVQVAVAMHVGFRSFYSCRAAIRMENIDQFHEPDFLMTFVMQRELLAR